MGHGVTPSHLLVFCEMGHTGVGAVQALDYHLTEPTALRLIIARQVSGSRLSLPLRGQRWLHALYALCQTSLLT